MPHLITTPGASGTSPTGLSMEALKNLDKVRLDLVNAVIIYHIHVHTHSSIYLHTTKLTLQYSEDALDEMIDSVVLSVKIATVISIIFILILWKLIMKTYKCEEAVLDVFISHEHPFFTFFTHTLVFHHNWLFCLWFSHKLLFLPKQKECFWPPTRTALVHHWGGWALQSPVLHRASNRGGGGGFVVHDAKLERICPFVSKYLDTQRRFSVVILDGT